MSPPSTKVQTQGWRGRTFQGAVRALARGLEERLKESPLLFSHVGSEAGRGLAGRLAENLPWLTFSSALLS